MATTETIHTAESVPDSFDALQGRFLSLTSRLEVISQALYSEDNTPNGVTPAAFVLRDTTRDVIQLQEDIEGWAQRHEHTPKAKEVQS